MLRGPIRQPYQSWKGPEGSYPVWNGIVPSNSRPSSNGVMENPDDYQSAFGTARPLKQWRKAACPSCEVIVISQSKRESTWPGGSVSTNTSVLCPSCDSSQSVASVNTLVFGDNSFLTSATPNSTFSGGITVTDVANKRYGKCISCNPESNVIKSGKTLLNKNYYQTTKGYLSQEARRSTKRPLLRSVLGSHMSVLTAIHFFPVTRLTALKCSTSPTVPPLP